jgi:hypothetical protein
MKTTAQLINEKVEAFRQELLKEFSENKFEVGKWYKDFEGRILFIEGLNDDSTVTGYGFAQNKIWYNSSKWYMDFLKKIKEYNITPATDKEVEEALTNEFYKKNGRKSRYNVKSINSGNVFILMNTFRFDAKINTLWMRAIGGGILEVFKDGKWAEIVDDKIMIGGYEVKKLESNGINELYRIGCKTIDYATLKRIEVLMLNNSFKTVAFDGIETDLETIEKILKL